MSDIVGNPVTDFCMTRLIGISLYLDVSNITVLIVHLIVLFGEPDRCFRDGGQENRREVGTYVGHPIKSGNYSSFRKPYALP